jgi:RNA polymerase sigma-70 factor (ECF subfamily)
MQDREDKDILEDLQNPDRKESAFRELVEKYQERLYYHIRKIVILHEDADDVLQNTFVKVWQSLPGFRGDSGLYTWLYRIATNEALSTLKQKKKRAFAPWVDVEHRLGEHMESDPWFDGEEASQQLQKAILKLPEKQRIVFNMKYFDELKYEDMAAILDTSVGALKASYHHAVKKIEKSLKTGLNH